MNKMVVLAACAMLAGSAAHGAAASQRSYDVGAFDKVAAAGPHHVVVTVGGARSVRASGDPDVLDKMEVKVTRDGLEIGPRKEYRQNFSWKGLSRATFYVTVPRLTDAAVAGSGDMAIDRIGGRSFSAAVAGSGNMRIASLEVDQASISVAGSGTMSVKGRAKEADISVAGSGRLDAQALAINDASVSIAGSGDARLVAHDTADVSIVGSGRVDVGGSPRCSVSRIGSGKVRCGA